MSGNLCKCEVKQRRKHRYLFRATWLKISGDMTLVLGDLTVNRLNKSTGIKFRAFCLFVTTGYPFSIFSRKFTMSRQWKQRESQKGNRTNFRLVENSNVHSNSQPRFFAHAAIRRCNIVEILFRLVATLFQHCNAVLRRIVSYNITLTVRKFRRIAV